MPNHTLSPSPCCSISNRAPDRAKPREKRHLMDLAMQDHTGSSVENAVAMQKYGVGQPVRRKEDDTLVRGKGRYTDDFNLPGQVYAYVVRSSHAHGVIRGIDTKAAK